MKYKIDISDEVLCKIIRDAMEVLMGDHPETHPMTIAAEIVMDYFSIAPEMKKSLKRVKKLRKERYT